MMRHYAKVQSVALSIEHEFRFCCLIQLGFKTCTELLLVTIALLGVVEDVDQLGLVDSVHHGDTTVELNNGDIKHVLLGGLLSRRIDIDLIELEGDLCWMNKGRAGERWDLLVLMYVSMERLDTHTHTSSFTCLLISLSPVYRTQHTHAKQWFMRASMSVKSGSQPVEIGSEGQAKR